MSHFHGTAREPALRVGRTNSGEMVLTPFYPLIGHAGLSFNILFKRGFGSWKLFVVLAKALHPLLELGASNTRYMGLRVSLNDAQPTKFLSGVITDSDDGSHLLSVEASRRLSENLKVRLEGRAFADIPSGATTFCSLSLLGSSSVVPAESRAGGN